MQNPEQAQMVFFTGTMFYSVLVATYGAFGYMQGFASCDIITNCLPPGATVKVIRVALCLSLLAPHTITLFPAVELLETIIFKADTKHLVWKKRIMCTILVLITGLGSAAIGDNFGLFSSFVGSLGITSIGFFIPVAMYVATFKETMGLGMWIGCSWTVFFGLGAMISGTYVATLQVIGQS